MKAQDKFMTLGYAYYDDDGFTCYEKSYPKGLEPAHISFNRGDREVFISRNNEQIQDMIISLELYDAIKLQIEEFGW